MQTNPYRQTKQRLEHLPILHNKVSGLVPAIHDPTQRQTRKTAADKNGSTMKGSKPMKDQPIEETPTQTKLRTLLETTNEQLQMYMYEATHATSDNHRQAALSKYAIRLAYYDGLLDAIKAINI
jgi:hypothetical protein